MGDEGRAGGEWLRGQRVLVAAAGLDITSAVLAGLVDGGARVALLSDNEDPLAAARPAVEHTRTTFGSRLEIKAAVVARTWRSSEVRSSYC